MQSENPSPRSHCGMFFETQASCQTLCQTAPVELKERGRDGVMGLSPQTVKQLQRQQWRDCSLSRLLCDAKPYASRRHVTLIWLR